MRILILANTDQRGKSGVGDFALTLWEQLRGCDIDATFAVIDPDPAVRDGQLTGLMQEIDPDWVSLHFVPYAYANRGMVGKRTLPWKKIRGRTGTHILFHEIWVGAHQGASWRHRLTGVLQKRGIKQCLDLLKPDVVHCTNSLYSSMLNREGISNTILPLFGAIPFQLGSRDPYLDVVCSLEPGWDRSRWVIAALFGSIHPTNSFLHVLQWLSARCNRSGKKLFVVSLGHAPNAKTFFETLSNQFPQACKPYFHVTGKLDATDLSSWIRGADCGLATTPFNIIDKSSSAVAFAEHGVPVIVTDSGSPVPGITNHQQDLAPEFWLFGDERLDTFELLPPRRAPQSRLECVTSQFLADLNLHG
jgi:hypothetical protein